MVSVVSVGWRRSGFALALFVVACGGSSLDEREGNSGGTGATETGGTATGGTSNSGSGGTTTGGTTTGGSGGTATGGTTTGGTTTGGSGGTATGGTATGGTATGGTATGGTATGGTGGAEPPECTPLEDPDPVAPDDCPELERLALWNPRVEDSSGDGKVSPGERAVVRVVFGDVSGLGHLGYPGVVFEADDPHVEFLTDPEVFELFGLLGCDSHEAEVEIQVGEVALDTAVEVVARAGSLNRECPDAPSIAIPIALE